jgi:hypothetical protein
MKSFRKMLAFLACCLAPGLAHALDYAVTFDALTAGNTISQVVAAGPPAITVTVSSVAASPLYVGNVWTTTSSANYLATGTTDASLGFYLAPFLPGEVIRFDFSAPVTSLSASFVTTAGGPTDTPFAISDIPSGGSANSASKSTLDATNGYDSWSVGYAPASPFTTAYLVSTAATFDYEGTSYPEPYSFVVDDIAFTATVNRLDLTVAGTNGFVTASSTGSADLICYSGACSQNYFPTASVSIAANTTCGVVFTSWGGDCSGTGACSVTMNAPHSVTAAYATATGNVNGTSYATLANAYAALADGAVLKVRGIEMTENVSFNRPVSVTLRTGYDICFISNFGSPSVIHGSMEVAAGTIIVEGITLMP